MRVLNPDIRVWRDIKGTGSLVTTSNAINPSTLNYKQIQAGLGALVGSAVGDALGAPFEFRSAGSYTRRFAEPVLHGTAEMIGGGDFHWAAGEFTDDSQMAIVLAQVLLQTDGQLDLPLLWEQFVAWSRYAKDVGNTTRAALSHHDYRSAAEHAHHAIGRSGSNGSVMRSTPLGLLGVRWGRDLTVSNARAQSSLTHFDPVAQWSSAIVAEVIRSLILGTTLDAAVLSAISCVDVEYRQILAEVLDPSWKPDHATMSNGSALVCLAQAMWAIRTTSSFEDAVVRAINLGDDADTVAAVCGGMAGALYGIQQIPARWVTYVHGSVQGLNGEVVKYHQHDLVAMGHNLLGVEGRDFTPSEALIPVSPIHSIGVFASNILGAQKVDADYAVVSLCRMEDTLHHVSHRREFFLIDEWGEGHNPHLRTVCEDAVNSMDAFLRNGKNVLVHCHGGRSRTGFILKAWYMRRYGVDHVEAHDWLYERWPHYVTWNEDFEDFLNFEWEAK